MAEWVDLKEAIARLREQLTEAIDEGKDKGMHFRVAPIELTLQAAVTVEGNGTLGWKILEVGGSRQAASTQTLKLVLTPVWKMQDGSVVEDPLISGTLPGAGEGWRADYGPAEDAGQEPDPVDPD